MLPFAFYSPLSLFGLLTYWFCAAASISKGSDEGTRLKMATKRGDKQGGGVDISQPSRCHNATTDGMRLSELSCNRPWSSCLSSRILPTRRMRHTHRVQEKHKEGRGERVGNRGETAGRRRLFGMSTGLCLPSLAWPCVWLVRCLFTNGLCTHPPTHIYTYTYTCVYGQR